MQSDELLLFSTDYPHCAVRRRAIRCPPGLPPALVRKIMVDNPRATYARLLEPVRMNVQVRPSPHRRRPRSRLAIADCDIHPAGAAPTRLDPWLPQRWREHMRHLRRRPAAGHGTTGRPTRRASRTPRAATPIRPRAGGRAAASSFMQAQHLDPNNVELGILNPLAAARASRTPT